MDRVCAKCAKRPALWVNLQQETDACCSHCEERAPTITLSDCASFARDQLQRFFDRESDEAAGPDSCTSTAWGMEWRRPGVPVADAIRIILQCTREVSEATRLLIRGPDEEVDRTHARAYLTEPYDRNAHYSVEFSGYTSVMSWWEAFELAVQHQSRYFNEDARIALDHIFEGASELVREAPNSIMPSGHHGVLDGLYRARVFGSLKDINEALTDPVNGLGPPPMGLARQGRMNSQGRPVFYGATLRQTAIDEVRPPVGARVLSGRFTIHAPLRLLDLTSLEAMLPPDDRGEGEYYRLADKIIALKRICALLTRPDTNYLLSNIVSDYLAASHHFALDGLVYPSTQSNQGSNVTLFTNAARSIRPIGKLPPREKHEELQRSAFRVREAMHISLHRSPVVHEVGPHALELDLSTLRVHTVESVSVGTSDCAVGIDLPSTPPSPDPVHLHHLVTEVVDHLHRDPSR